MDKETKIDDVFFSVRTENCLLIGGFKTLGDIINSPGYKLMDLDNFGNRSFHEVRKLLKDEMNIDWPLLSDGFSVRKPDIEKCPLKKDDLVYHVPDGAIYISGPLVVKENTKSKGYVEIIEHKKIFRRRLFKSFDLAKMACCWNIEIKIHRLNRMKKSLLGRG